MYTILKSDGGDLETRVRQAVACVYRQGHGLPDYLLAPEMVDRPPVHIDGFLVMGSRCVAAGQMCLVSKLSDRPRVRFENSNNALNGSGAPVGKL